MTIGGCQWICNAGYAPSGSVCASCAVGSYCNSNASNTCPTYTSSVAGSSTASACTCVVGTYGFGVASACTPCPAGYYCPGTLQFLPWQSLSAPLTAGYGNRRQREHDDAVPRVLHEPDRERAAGAVPVLARLSGTPQFTYAKPMRYVPKRCAKMMEQGANGTTCTLCPANTICLSGSLSNCTSNAASTAGTSTKCTCNAGFYSVVSGVGLCTQCPPGSYCTGDTVNTACTANAYSSPQVLNSSPLLLTQTLLL